MFLFSQSENVYLEKFSMDGFCCVLWNVRAGLVGESKHALRPFVGHVNSRKNNIFFSFFFFTDDVVSKLISARSHRPSNDVHEWREIHSEHHKLSTIGFWKLQVSGAREIERKVKLIAMSIRTTFFRPFHVLFWYLLIHLDMMNHCNRLKFR